jgi:predicted nucleic acid-binding protein
MLSGRLQGWRPHSLRVAMEKFKALMELVEGRVVRVASEEDYLGEAFRIALETGLTLYDLL